MIRTVAVLGAGVMGSEIAQAAAAGGMRVVLLDADPVALERGLAHVTAIGRRRVERGRLDAPEAEAILARIATATDPVQVAGCDLAIEAVPEVLDIKRSVFRTLDAALAPGAILASNTSGLSISALAGETTRPDRVVGLHFFNPASVMRLVEVIRGTTTGEETLLAVEDFARALGKTPVRVRECPGFLVNRILLRAMCEAYRQAAAGGADPAAADAAVVAGGPAPMGPHALGDLIGLDTMGHIQGDLVAAYGTRFDDAGAISGLVGEGRLGRKSGAGFFDGEPPAAPAPDAAALEVASRYYEGALDEARRCIDEGVAAGPDVDVAMRLGCGWEMGPLEWERAGRPAA